MQQRAISSAVPWLLHKSLPACESCRSGTHHPPACPCAGKSTLAALLAARLGISTVVSTDSIRHMMRRCAATLEPACCPAPCSLAFCTKPCAPSRQEQAVPCTAAAWQRICCTLRFPPPLLPTCRRAWLLPRPVLQLLQRRGRPAAVGLHLPGRSSAAGPAGRRRQRRGGRPRRCLRRSGSAGAAGPVLSGRRARRAIWGPPTGGGQGVQGAVGAGAGACGSAAGGLRGAAAVGGGGGGASEPQVGWVGAGRSQRGRSARCGWRPCGCCPRQADSGWAAHASALLAPAPPTPAHVALTPAPLQHGGAHDAAPPQRPALPGAHQVGPPCTQPAAQPARATSATGQSCSAAVLAMAVALQPQTGGTCRCTPAQPGQPFWAGTPPRSPRAASLVV